MNNLSPLPSATLIRTANIVYALHALGLVIGAFGSATLVGSFLLGWPSIVAVVINYIYRDDARGTWLESHFDWQIRTFWYALVWSVVVAVVAIPTMLILVGFGIWSIGMGLLGLWAIYRVARGWLRLNDGLPMPKPPESAPTL
jgi:uncharacterized membrane protein